MSNIVPARSKQTADRQRLDWLRAHPELWIGLPDDGQDVSEPQSAALQQLAV